MNLISKALRYDPIARGSHSFTCHPHEPYLPLFRKHSPCTWRHPNQGSRHLIAALLLIYRLRKDERLSWPGWLTCSGWFTHIGGHPSAAGRARAMESSPAKDRRSTTVLRNQLNLHWVLSRWWPPQTKIGHKPGGRLPLLHCIQTVSQQVGRLGRVGFCVICSWQTRIENTL